ncbi:MAG: shikimate kinase [Planctomycetota bacterium]
MAYKTRPDGHLQGLDHHARSGYDAAVGCLLENDCLQRKMPKEKSNVVLIGMPGCGKSTIGVLLAKRLQMAFVDTDLIIQKAEAMPLSSDRNARHGFFL